MATWAIYPALHLAPIALQAVCDIDEARRRQVRDRAVVRDTMRLRSGCFDEAARGGWRGAFDRLERLLQE